MGDGVNFRKLAIDLRAQLDASLAREIALEQRRHAEQRACQAAERRVEELAAEVKRLDLMVSQGDYNYDADRAQFKTRIAELSADSQHLRKLLGQALAAVNPTKRLAKDIRAALNPTAEVAREALKPENQRITPARFKCLACGDYHDGSGNLPCPKMSPYAGIKP